MRSEREGEESLWAFWVWGWVGFENKELQAFRFYLSLGEMPTERPSKPVEKVSVPRPVPKSLQVNRGAPVAPGVIYLSLWAEKTRKHSKLP